MSPDCKISECPEFEVKSKLFMNEKILEEYSLRVYEIDPFFSGHHKANFTEQFLAVEIDEQDHEGRELICEKKRQQALEKKLACKFIRINTSNARRDYDTDYEVSKIQIFISKFEDEKLKELEKESNKLKRKQEGKIKELED